MADRVVHFEIPYDDAGRAREFYGAAFGWEAMELPDQSYTIVTTGPSGDAGPTEPGFINGGLFRRREGFAGPNVVIGVDSVDAALAAVAAAGGTTVSERSAVGDMGFTGYFTDTEGNLVGLWETAVQG